MSVKKHLIKRSLAAILGKHFEPGVVEEGSSGSVLVELARVFDRYDALVEQLEADATLKSCVDRVRDWQCQRVQQTYQTLLDHPSMGEASHFVLTQAYAGPNQAALVQSVRRVVNRTAKIFPLPLLKTVTDILALNTLTLALDLQMALTLAQCGFCPRSSEVLSENLYEEAFCFDERFSQRQEQLALLEKVGSSIEQHLGSQWVYTAFQMAQLPARKMGYGVLVDFMKPGFEAIHNLPVSAEQLLAIIVETEQHCLRQLMAGERQVFSRVRVAQVLEPERHHALNALARRPQAS